MQNSPLEFLKEAAIMHGIENTNIVRLYGVVLDIDSLMLVFKIIQMQ
jgi:activated CDC42 kinase 1